jgi:hypothetical protein
MTSFFCLTTACSTVIWYSDVGWAVPPNATGDEENYRGGPATLPSLVEQMVFLY